ncbi:MULTISPECIES: polysaccharide biosynthesis tyrosine autokinase [Rhizobium]|uniref:polysaccharide biosynthesis tyrosine autokinase n=1 Tax=Rhizobium TaxID=379 RepID=UPI001FAE5EF8|nr:MULTISPECIES: polysaccharide biosynthesis tyrosine autokinase [Rhizobium]
MNIQSHSDTTRHQLDQKSILPQMPVVDFEKLVQIATRRWKIFGAACCAGLALGLVYLFAAQQLYTSEVTILMDDGNASVINELRTVQDAVDNENSILSQVELLQSDAVIGGAVDRLKLADNDKFLKSDGFLSDAIKTVRKLVDVKNWFVPDELTGDTATARRRAAINQIVANLDVVRVPRTYVLNVSFTWVDPVLAAQITNEIGQGYLLDKLNSNFETTERASSWLNSRIAELREQSRASDTAVQKFRSDNNLLSAGSVLVSDQQLDELTRALVVAQDAAAKAEARYSRIMEVLDKGNVNAVVADSLDSNISNDLQKKYLEASKRESEISNRLGPDHIQAIRLRAEMEQYKLQMFGELRRISNSYRNELEVAKAQERITTENLNKAKVVTAVAGEKQVELRQLERTAETDSNLLKLFLERYQQALQQQSFPVTDARIIAKAKVSDVPSHPRKPLLLALFLMAGAAIGLCLAALKEFRDRYFRTGEQVTAELGLQFLGAAPLLTPAKGEKAPVNTSANEIEKVSSVTNYVVEHPLSGFAETLRRAKIAADLAIPGDGCKTIGIISTLPGEGKSTIAANFAELLAKQGSRTVLVDCDLRNPGSTRSLARNARYGLLEVILGKMPIRQVLVRNSKTNLGFIPAVISQRVLHSSDLLTSAGMSEALSVLAADHDYIILDLPPLGPVVDARAMARKIDAFVYVAEWGKTSRRVVRHTLETENLIASKCLGVILNKVDEQKLRLYRSFGSLEFYNSRYQKYYIEQA